MEMDSFDIWKLLAGLGIFLFGMFLVEESVRKLSGRAFKKFIKRYTTGRLKSIGSGIAVTSVLQSSSAVSLMILAFVGAGIMTMENGIGVILGSNIGTTVTGWIVATFGFKFSIEAFALPMIGIGGLGTIFLGKSERYSNISKLLVGFGFLFMGLDYMKSAVEVFAAGLDVNEFKDYGILVFVLVGIALTALMQSSSATLAIALTTLNAGVISFNDAAALAIGANIGTTATIILGAIGATQVKKRVALSHFIFNFVTGAVGLILLPILSYSILMFLGDQQNGVIALALFHTIFNVIGVLLFFPFVGRLAKFLNKVIPERDEHLTKHIPKTTRKVPEAATHAIRLEGIHLVKRVFAFHLRLIQLPKNIIFGEEEIEDFQGKQKLSLNEEYQSLKILQADILQFASNVQSEEISQETTTQLNRYLHGVRMTLHAAKTMKDIKHDFDDFQSEENNYLNKQFENFRDRMSNTYYHLDLLIEKSDKASPLENLINLMSEINSEDKEFVQQTTNHLAAEKITGVNYSTAIVVNRAFVQASKQLILALKELLLTEEEIIEFEREVETYSSLPEVR